MFTGLVEETGVVKKKVLMDGSIIFSIAANRTVTGLKRGDSIAVDGVCLTVLKRRGRIFQVQAVEETLSKTTLGDREEGSLVNLERPVLPTTRMGGHFVLGHVDTVGVVERIEEPGSSWLIWFVIPQQFARYLIPVGSVAVNGVSLTVARLYSRRFAVAIIPETLRKTNFRVLTAGDRVNIEFDVLGKYVLRLLGEKSLHGRVRIRAQRRRN